MGKTGAFQKIENGSDCKHVVDVDVADEAGEREVEHFSESRNTRRNACDKVGNFEWNYVAEL